ncbi:MAG: hypothetical protein H7A23_13365 [Leptospiraceae bacterium]|nr:hypothetical protein [Leptospiraceae bacterium]MCP5495539.1 hypothetical protein [Leptospiraceae bacterium]
MRIFIKFILLVFLFGISINAQTDRKKRGELIRKHCKSDKEKFCKDKEYGNIIKCLKNNKDSLSPQCKSILFEKIQKAPEERSSKEEFHKDRGKRIRENCKDDREKFCNNTKYGSIIKCLKSNQHQLSNKCKDALKR